MRILEIETFGRGGLIHYAYNLSCALAERGHEVTLLTASGYELGEWRPPAGLRLVTTIAGFTNRNASKIPPPLLGPVRSLEAGLDALRVARFGRRLRPDVIHFHSTNTSALVYLTRLRRLGIPIVATAHVVTPHERIRFQDAIYRRIHLLSHLRIAHSEADRRRLQEEFDIGPESVAVIPHGEYGFFDAGPEPSDRDSARQSLGLSARDKVALFFGYIREYKGLDVLLEAWPRVVRELPDARLVIAGDAGRLPESRRRELLDRASRCGAICRFEYIPFSDVARYFRAADVLAMPYRRISQSGVLYLALSLGVPVVATNVGALPEVLRDGESALLVPPDSPPDLARALERSLKDVELRRRLAEGGRQVAESHSWPAIAARTEEAFARLVES
jgi:glycosyltransferase involved in cell wall biosynthesis